MPVTVYCQIELKHINISFQMDIEFSTGLISRQYFSQLLLMLTKNHAVTG